MTITLTHKQNGSCCSDEVGTSEAAFPFTFFYYSYSYTFLLPLQFFNFVFQPIPFYKQFLWVFIRIYFLHVFFMFQDASPSLFSTDVAVVIAECCSTNWQKTVDVLVPGFLFFFHILKFSFLASSYKHKQKVKIAKLFVSQRPSQANCGLLV